MHQQTTDNDEQRCTNNHYICYDFIQWELQTILKLIGYTYFQNNHGWMMAWYFIVSEAVMIKFCPRAWYKSAFNSNVEHLYKTGHSQKFQKTLQDWNQVLEIVKNKIPSQFSLTKNKRNNQVNNVIWLYTKENSR